MCNAGSQQTFKTSKPVHISTELIFRKAGINVYNTINKKFTNFLTCRAIHLYSIYFMPKKYHFFYLIMNLQINYIVRDLGLQATRNTRTHRHACKVNNNNETFIVHWALILYFCHFYNQYTNIQVFFSAWNSQNNESLSRAIQYINRQK